MKGSLQRRRDRLFEQSPYCYYCGSELVHPKEVGGTNERGEWKWIKGCPDNMATLDHVDSKLSPYRIAGQPYFAGRTVLACHYCNRMRNHFEQTGQSHDQIRHQA